MAEITGNLGLCIVKQTTLGTLEPTLPTGSATVDVAAGAILGDPESGEAESGISFTASRVAKAKGFASGGFTSLGDDFQRSEITTFQFAFPLAGPRTAASNPAVDADFDFPDDVGIDALLQACGLAGAAWGGGVGEEYTPADAAVASVRLWFGDSGDGYSLGIKDVIGSLSIDMTPGEIAVATATLTGVIDTKSVIGFPTFDYGVQGTVSPPSVESMGASWGETRGWSELTVSIDNELQTVPDSNAEGGVRSRQTGRAITAQMTIRSDDGGSAGIDFEYDNLVGSNPTDDLTAATGTTAALGDAVHWGIEMNNLQVSELAPSRVGSDAAHVIQAACTAQSDGGEFSLIFR